MQTIFSSVFDKVERWLAFIFGFLMVILALAQVIFRYIFHHPLVWSEEIGRATFIWVVFLGMSMAVRRQAHISVDFLVNMLPTRLRLIIDIIGKLIMLFFLGALTISGAQLVSNTGGMYLTSVQLPVTSVYVCAPLLAAIMFIRYIIFLVGDLKQVLKP